MTTIWPTLGRPTCIAPQERHPPLYLANRQRLGHNAAMNASSPLQHRDDRGLRIAAAVVAAVGMLEVGVFYLAAGLVAPAWAIVVLWIVWLALAAYGLRLARAGSYLVLAVPVLAGVIWYLALTTGERVLGWQA